MLKIYVSSTYSDLRQHRKAVYDALRELRYDVVAMENYIAADERPLEKCLRDVAESDIYVGIFAWRFGFIPAENNPDRRSITELEYRHAGQLGIPRLIFVLDEQAPWPPVHMDSKTDNEDRGRRIESLRSELGTDRIVSFFSSIEELARKVNTAVQLQQGAQESQAQVIMNPEVPEHRFTEHMRRFAGAASHYQASARYAGISIQEVEFTNAKLRELPTGSWTDLVSYPAAILLASEAGSGKTTLLLHEANRLAAGPDPRSGAQAPVYFSMAGFRSGGAQALLEMAADANAMNYRALEAAWSDDGTPRICMLINDADRYTANDASISSIRQLMQRKAPAHSLVVACHPGEWRDSLRESTDGFREFLILPLNQAEIADFLKRFARDELAQVSDSWIHEDTRIGEMLRRPDVLSAWLQSSHSGNEAFQPSVGVVLKLYLAHLFSIHDSKYDYDRIKVPVMAKLAYDLVNSGQSSFILDDTIYDQMVSLLQTLSDKYRRRRRVMPGDWTAEELLDEIVRSPVFEPIDRELREFRFSRKRFQDFFLAMELELSRTDSGSVVERLANVSSADLVDALIMALGLAPVGYELVEDMSVVRADLAQQVWIEGRPAGQSAPSSIQREFTRRREGMWERFSAAHRSEFLRQSSSFETLKRPKSSSDLDAIHALKQLSKMPQDALLEIAAHSHPLVQGLIDYMLLRFGEESWEQGKPMRLPLSFQRDGRFAFRGTGGGEVRIGNLTLLKMPVPSDVSVSVSVQRLSFDPFLVDSKIRMLPTPAVSVAARAFRDLRTADWIGFAALCHCLSASAAKTAEHASQYDNFQDLGERLNLRSADFNAMGQVIADDLGLSWSPTVEQGSKGDLDLAYEQYRRLRRTFGMANESRLLTIERAARAASRTEENHEIAVSMSAERVKEGGRFLGIMAEEIRPASDTSIEYYIPQRARLVTSQSIREVVAGTVGGIVIQTMKSALQYLPINLTLDCSLSVDKISTGMVSGISIQQLLGRYPNCEVECSVAIGELAGSLEGVVVQDHEDD